ncbi:hypothetical protein [Sphaerotilus sp.]|uniref:hypothetical protein n=1 Tax=Sphaerotilus sp. TaxID=2093942 RepID=UPI0034E1EBE2
MTLKHLLALAVTAGAIGSAAAQPSVGVSIGINQPGVYGQIHIGNLPPPALVVPQPVYVERDRRDIPPIYIYAPEAHQRHWGRYCGQYDACNRPVYFVREEWVRDRYESEHPGWDRGRGHGHGRWQDREERRHGDHGSRD